MAPGTPRRGRPKSDGITRLLSDTQDMVTRLLQENRFLKAQNKRLADELERVSTGLDEVRRTLQSRGR